MRRTYIRCKAQVVKHDLTQVQKRKDEHSIEHDPNNNSTNAGCGSDYKVSCQGGE